MQLRIDFIKDASILGKAIDYIILGFKEKLLYKLIISAILSLPISLLFANT